MGQAAHAGSIYFTAGPAIVGLVVHMMTGAVADGVFGALAGWVRPPGQ